MSPLPGRNDSKPSFVVDKARNRWRDFGISDDWDRIVRLVCLMENSPLGKVLDILLGEKKSTYKKAEEVNVRDMPKNISIVKSSKYFSTYLLRYVRKRKLNINLVRKYCKQIEVCFPNSKHPDRVYQFIGFKNNLGGYELRNPTMKVSTSPKYYTVIGAGKERFIFEGFMDYLSFLIYKKIDNLKGTVIVLNSLTLLPWIFDIMRSDGTNNLYFDNDRAAEKQIKLLEKEKIGFIDHRRSYKMYNDLNKMLCGEIML